jgi:polyphosphate kinase
LRATVREVLDVQLADTVKARRLDPDGKSRRLASGNGHAVRAQERLYALAAAAERRSQPPALARLGL